VNTFLQYLTQDQTLLGITFQNWVPFVTGIFIVWIIGLAVWSRT